MTLTDPAFIQALRQGDLAAFESLFHTFYRPLIAYACQLIKDPATAEEIVQETFCRVHAGREKLNITQSLKAYLYAMVYHECLKQQKQRRRITGLPEPASSGELTDPGTPADKMQFEQLQTRAWSAVNRLPEKCRQIFCLHRVEKLKYREIAQRLGISEKTVENQMTKAIRLLKKQLAEFLTLIILLICSL